MENTNIDVLEFKIGIVGPSRVGKTTLLTSILENAHDLLAGKSMSFETEDDKTKTIVSDSNNALDGSLYAGEFDVGALGGTQTPTELNFVLSHSSVSEIQIKVRFLDFPGGLLDNAPARKEEWGTCLQWIKNSPILMVPVDASVLMEATNSTHVKSIPSILSLHNVEEVVRCWAKFRKEIHDDSPGTLLFCPLKCESYFNDNGGRRDDSEKLLLAVKKFYGDIISAAKKEYPQLEIIYSPIDSIGCVEILDGKWQKVAGNGQYQFFPSFRVRNQSSKRSVKGADAILINVFRAILSTTKKIKENLENLSDEERKKRIEFMNKDEGVIFNFLNWISGESDRRKTSADESEQIYRKMRDARIAVEKIIEEIGAQQPERQISRLS